MDEAPKWNMKRAELMVSIFEKKDVFTEIKGSLLAFRR